MMNSTSDGDPFIQVQSDAIALLTTTRQLISSYLRIRSLATSITSPELASARSDVLSAIEDLSTDLEDLRLAVSECERDPYRFGLEIQQVAQRRRWLTEIEGEISDMQEELDKESIHVGTSNNNGNNSSNNNKKRQSYNPDHHINKNNNTNGHSGGGNNGNYNDRDDNNNNNDDPYTAHEQLHQQQLMRDQDEQLDSVYRTVRNLGIQAGDMGRELEEQNEIIQETDAIAERVDGKLKKGVKGLDRFIRKNEDRWSSCCISILIFVLIILLILVLVL